MPEIADIMDVNIEDLSPEQRQQLQDAIDQFQQKCLLSFKKNRSGVPYLKNEMPRVLLPGESDTTTQQEREECMQAFWESADYMLSKHHKAFLGAFQQIMVAIFGPGMEQAFSKAPVQRAPWSWASQALNHHYGASQFSLLLRALEVKLSNLLRRAPGVNQFNPRYRPQEGSQSSRHHRAARVNLCNSRIRTSLRTET
jgi:alpha-beta hydrolase superfamily lysophospholipase